MRPRCRLEALERATGRRAVWAAAKYLSYARPPEIMDIEVTVAVAGHQTTQGRAIGRVGDREILTVNGALGERDASWEGQWVAMPNVPPPDDCPPRHHVATVDDSVAQRLEMRLAIGQGPGQVPGARRGAGPAQEIAGLVERQHARRCLGAWLRADHHEHGRAGNLLHAPVAAIDQTRGFHGGQTVYR